MSDNLPRLLYDKAEAAEILGLEESSIEWLLRNRQITKHKIAGKIRFTLEDLKATVSASAVDPNATPAGKEGD